MSTSNRVQHERSGLYVELPRATRESLRALCESKGYVLRAFVQRAIEREMKREEEKNGDEI